MAKIRKPKLTHAELLDWLDYNPETGVFARRHHSKKNKYGGVGRPYSNGYWCIGIRQERFLAHRLAWFYVYGEWPRHELDHINLDKTDNRIANIRKSDRSLNNANRTVYAKSGFKGVVPSYGGKWRAQITIRNQHFNLGTFNTPEEAHQAWKAKATEAFGDAFRGE